MLHFRLAGTTPQCAHHALVSLFCRTGGASNDLIHWLIARHSHSLTIDGGGVLGLGGQELDQIACQLRERSYYVFERRLPADVCHRLLEFALAEKAVVRIDEQPRLETYDRQNQNGVRWTMQYAHRPADQAALCSGISEREFETSSSSG